MPAISAPNPYHDRQRIRSRRVNHPAISDVPVACPVALPSHTLSVGDFGPTGGGRSLMRRSCWARRLASRTSRIFDVKIERPAQVRSQRGCRPSRVFVQATAWMLDPGHRASGRPPGITDSRRRPGLAGAAPDGRQNANSCYGGVGPCGNFLHRKISSGDLVQTAKIAVAASGSSGGDGLNTHGHRSADPTGGDSVADRCPGGRPAAQTSGTGPVRSARASRQRDRLTLISAASRR